MLSMMRLLKDLFVVFKIQNEANGVRFQVDQQSYIFLNGLVD